MMSDIAVRACSVDDMQSFGDWFGSEWTRARSREPEGQFGSTCLVALDGDTPVGHGNVRWGGSLHPTWRAHLVGCPEINGLAASPTGRGIGTLLITTAEKLARDRAFDRIGLGVEVDNPRACLLYARLGYVTWDGSPVVMLSGKENLFMTKSLDGPPGAATA